MSRRLRSDQPHPLAAALWLSTGAAFGLLVGILLADRSSAGRRVARAVGPLLNAVARMWEDDSDDRDERERDDDDLGDDDIGAEDVDMEAESDADYDDGTGDYELQLGDELGARVLAAFEQDPILSVRSIDIEGSGDGTITLTGRVPSARDAAHAVTIARGTPGVERVENRLSVVRRHSVRAPAGDARR